MTAETETHISRTDLLESFQLREYWDIVQRRKWWVIFPTVALFCCVSMVALRLPSTYRAETTILVDPQQVPSNYVVPTVTTSVTDRLSTIQEQVLSPTRLGRLINTMGLYQGLHGKHSEQELVRRMQKATSVEIVGSGGSRQSAFRIAFQGRNPQEVADVANQIANMFIQENLTARARATSGATDFIQSELQETKRVLDQKDAELRELRGRSLLDLPESKQFHLESLASLRSQHQANEDRVRSAQQQKVLLQSMGQSEATAPTIDLDSVGNSAATSPYQTEIQKLETNLSALRTRYGPNYPDVRKVEKELNGLKARAAEDAKQNPVQVVSEQANPVQRRRRNPVLDAQISKLDQEIAELTKQQAALQRQIDEHMSRLEQVPVFEQKIAGMMRDYDSLRQHYSSLEDKKLSAEMAEALEVHQKGERFIILDAAVVPEKPFGPNRWLIGLAGLLGGLLGGLVLAIITEVNDESVRSEVEASKILGLPVLVGIPIIAANSQRWKDTILSAMKLAATAACSVALGFLVSQFAAGWF